MKTLKMSFLTSMVLGLSIVLFSCSSAAENKENAEQDLAEANKALELANKEYLEDIENYRSEIKVSIAHNDSLIAVHKQVMQDKGLTENPFYKTEIEKLEAQNKMLQLKMEDYKGDGKDNWTIFKEEFDHDMKELGQSLKDLTVKNTK